jgi:hypothetical protein
MDSWPITGKKEIILNLGYSNAQGHTNPLRGCNREDTDLIIIILILRDTVPLYAQVVSCAKPNSEAVLCRALWAVQGFACRTEPHGLYEALQAVRSGFLRRLNR